MKSPLPTLLDDITNVLHHKVLPQLSDDATRGEVFAIIFLLNNLKRSADWAVEPLLKLIQNQDLAFDALRPLLAPTAGALLPPIPRVPQTLPSGDDLSSLYDDGDALLSQLLPYGRLGKGFSEIEQVLKTCMRAEIDLEIKYSARPMMGEISSGRENP